MAEIVRLPNIADRVVTSEAPRPNLSPGEIAQPYSMLGRALEQTGEAADTAAESLATQAGYKAVTSDGQGNLQIEKAPIIGPASQYYERAMKMAAMTQAEGDARRADIQLRQQFRDQPDQYLQAADAFTQKMKTDFTTKGGPELGLAIQKAIEPITTYTYRGLLNEKERLDLARADTSIQAGLSSARDDLVAIARGGGLRDPEGNLTPTAAKLWDKITTLTNERVSNPRLAYPRDKADYDLQQLDGDLRANSFLHHIDDIYQNAPNKGEGAAAALTAAQQLLTDPSLKLSEAQREQYYHRAVGEVRANEAIRKQDIGEARLAFQELQQSSMLGLTVSPEDVDKVATAFQNAGDQGGSAKVYATFARKPLNDDFGRQSLSDQTSQLSAIRGQAAAKQAYDFFVSHGYAPVQAAGIVSNLAHESGLDPRAIGDEGTSIGLAQFHNERAAALREFARQKGTSPGDFQTQLEFIDKELRSTEGATFQRLQAASTPEEAAAAFVGYERPRGYTPENPAGALGYGSRLALAKAVASGQGVISTGTPASALWLQVNRARTLDTAARQQWKTVWDDYTKDGIRPPDKVMKDIQSAARSVGDHDLLEQIGAAGDRITAVQNAAERGLPEQAAQISEMTRIGAGGGLTPGQQGVLKDLTKRYEAITTGLRENPIATTVANFDDRFKTPAPLNLGDDKELAAGIAYRGRIAQFAAQNWRTGPVSALDKADLTQMQAALEAGDPAAKARIFNALATNLPEDIRNATLTKLGEKGPQAMVGALAGALARSAPDVSASILRGQQAIAADKGYVPEKAETQPYNDDLSKFLPASTFSLAARTDPNGPMAVASGAIRARYADLSAQSGDTSGKYSKDRLSQAVTDVTGGVLNHNGGSLIAPARGMTQGQFDATLWGLTDRDLNGVTTLAGEPVSATYLRANAQLESVGEGRYLVRLGKDTSRPIYAYQGANTEIPQKFVLDLRGRAPGQVPAGPNIVPGP